MLCQILKLSLNIFQLIRHCLKRKKPVWGHCPQTYVPDDNFEQALIDLGYDSGTLDNYVKTVKIKKITTLDVSKKNIADLKGIEDFFLILVN